MRSLRFSIGGLMGAVLLAAIASAGLAHPSASWAGVIDLLTRGMLCLAVVGAVCRTGAERASYLLTWWLIGLTALGALCAKGRRREVWLGASFLGAGFMIVAFCLPVFEERHPEWVVPSVRVLRAVRPPFEALVAALSGEPNSVATKNARIRRMLKRPVPMQFEEKSLDDLLKYVKLATKESDGKAIPIFVDPIGLQEAEKTMNSMINPIDLEGIELQTTLGLCLKQLGLAFVVKDGLLEITSIESWDELNTSPYDDPFQIVGHCLLALIAAGLGGVAAPVVCDLARGRRE